MASSTAILQEAQEAASREALCTFALRFRQKRPDVNLNSAVVPLKEEGVLPTSLLLCVRQPDRASFEAAGIESGGGEPGVLTIPAGVRLWLVDRQHPLSGLERALTRDKAKWLADHPLR